MYFKIDDNEIINLKGLQKVKRIDNRTIQLVIENELGINLIGYEYNAIDCNRYFDKLDAFLTEWNFGSRAVDEE